MVPVNNEITSTNTLNNDKDTKKQYSSNQLNLQDFSKQNLSIEDYANVFQQQRKALEVRMKEIEDTLKPKLQQVKTTHGINHRIKRHAQDGIYTAKDVAALEVIVDLMQHSPYLAPVRPTSSSYLSNNKSGIFKSNSNSNTNAIQIHIDIPYLGYFKRSADEPIKIRRVFVAKMSSPVDMEYKVQSFQIDNPENSITTDVIPQTLVPYDVLIRSTQPAAGVLFLLDPNNPRSIIPIKSLKNIIVRQSNEQGNSSDSPGISVTQKMEKTTSVKNMGRVTLSKDFIVSLNEELIKLYDKVNKANNSSFVEHNIKCRDTNKAEGQKISAHVAKRCDRHKIWAKIKKTFQHDRVCKCKCKPNEKMCKACAASDAVMNELIFEMDNLLNYMTRHCTEIQTYFYMNPAGGRKLKDAVHKLDVSLSNYFKRSKGYCQGTPCTSFYVKKQSNSQSGNKSGYIENHLVDDLESLDYSLNSAAKLNMCANESLKGHFENLIRRVRNCIYDKKMNRYAKSATNPTGGLYTLDNINVNIICRPDTTAGLTRPPDMNYKNSIGYIVTDPISGNDYDNEGVDDIIEQATEKIDIVINKQNQEKERIKKEELLLDVLQYEKSKISDEMAKVVSKHDITSTSEDAMDDINRHFFNSMTPIKPPPKKRIKRTPTDMRELTSELTNLPPLKPARNELYAMKYDTVIIDCNHRTQSRSPIFDKQIIWKTDRNMMLKYDNVVVDGPTVTIQNLQSRNTGNYSCSMGPSIHKIVTLSIITLPVFDVIFIPMYTSNNSCTYDDLKALQHLGPLMSRQACLCREHNSVAIDETFCLQDKWDDTTQLRATAIQTSCVIPDVRCSPKCRRDLQSSFALLCAANAPALASVPVLISRNGGNVSLTPSTRNPRSLIVTHTLRKKDQAPNHNFHQLASNMHPGNIDIVVSCPSGFYLLPNEKICVSCPSDTYSLAGDNTCYSCPPGTTSEPGADRCRISLRRMRRYDWWWYPPCGYTIAALGVLSACLICAVCALTAHMTGCRTPSVRHTMLHDIESRWTMAVKRGSKKRSNSSQAQSNKSHPLSPSAVILAKFFRRSSSSRATVEDFQENKFEKWKMKNLEKLPPPLPPIDFNLSNTTINED
ncbi:uncharacterized protein LOC113227678 [Hyposmocoma kahamanoa]|uniref:uncharacterized protein LOC113227678 n=1 Tax=Hyposmocoma kahamanoa TaxID=1477025 RepID=UPI000E6D682C|nr:uncharacterized protein LOC113227678 [Hyposmocoma kahamanoa]